MFCCPDIVQLAILYLRSEYNTEQWSTDVITSSSKWDFSYVMLRSH